MTQFDSYDYSGNTKEVAAEEVATTTTQEPTTTTTTTPLVDECSDGSHNCDANAVCFDEVDGFICVCNDGWEGDGVTCSDYDECQDEGTCPENATCTYLPGDVTCACNEGYVGNGLVRGKQARCK